jgi:hypothetical protein
MYLFKAFVFALLCLFFLGRCAQQVSPTGGKKDSIPPKLIQSIPLNKTLNFKENRIELFFDEYVIVDNITQKLIITPEADNPYSYRLNGQSVVLNFKKKFEDSTTYTLNFGDAIKDFAERNPAKNLKMVFSTGNSLDSGRVYGKVRDVVTNKPVFDALVGLYNVSDTLNPAKQKPYYFSRTDSSGIFGIENVQIKNYTLIAIDDKNRNMLYNAKDERIGFLTKNITAGSDSLHYDIPMALSDNTPLKIQRTLPKVNNYSVVFSKPVESVKVTFSDKDSLPYLIENGAQIKFFNVQPHADTTLVKLLATDSLGKSTEFEQKIAFLVPRGKERQKDQFTVTSKPEQNKPLPSEFTYRLLFNKPVQSVDDSRISVVSDSLTHEVIKNMKWTWNDTHNEMTINGKSFAKDSIKFDLPKGSIISVEGDTLSRLLIKHPVLNEEDYGILKGQVIGADSLDFIVELVDEQFNVFQSLYSSPYSFIHIPQGKYFLRLILDVNKNKKWDTGQIELKIQPEPIIYLPEKILIKSNFELNDVNISVPKEQ